MLPTLVLVAALAVGAPARRPDPPAAPGERAGAGAPLLLPGAPREARGAAGAPVLRLGAPAAGLRQYGGADDEAEYDDEDDEGRRPRLLLSAWGGEAFAGGGTGRSSGFYGGEVAWAFSRLDLGLAGAWYRSLRDADRAWTPVVLTRVTQRFLTRRGFEAAFSLGFGAGKPDGWIGWYQVALGIRMPLGPLFLGGELAFEQYDIIRLGAGLGVGF